nr:MAG TPA: hypothetical protein [Caudoviricetes sp.]
MVYKFLYRSAEIFLRAILLGRKGEIFGLPPLHTRKETGQQTRRRSVLSAALFSLRNDLTAGVQKRDVWWRRYAWHCIPTHL